MWRDKKRLRQETDPSVTKKEAVLSLSVTCCGGLPVGHLYRVMPSCHRVRKRKLNVRGVRGPSCCLYGGGGGVVGVCGSVWGEEVIEVKGQVSFLDGQLEGDVHLSFLCQRDDFRKLYNHFCGLVQVVTGQDFQRTGSDQSFGIVHSRSL